MPLRDAEMLALWERCRRHSPMERALVLLAGVSAARAETGEVRADAASEWADRSLGQLNVALLRAYEQRFGSQLHCQARCPSCRLELEFELEVADLCPPSPPAVAPWIERIGFPAGELALSLRPLTPADLLLTATESDPSLASILLAERLITALAWHGPPPAPTLTGEHGRLLPELAEQVAAALSRVDPLAEIALELHCSDCQKPWQAPLSPAEFLWQEIATRSRRLLHQIHTLASAYGWSEADILALGDARRQSYMECLTS